MASHRVGAPKVGRARKLLLDTSFLIALMERPTPWMEDLTEKLGRFEPIVITPVYGELQRLASGKARASRFAALAKELAEGGTIKIEATHGERADEELISRALEDGALVATLDSALIAQLKALRIGVVRLRHGRVELG